MAVLVVVSGRKLLRADPGAAKFGRTVALVELAHNAAVVTSVALASKATHAGPWEVWGIEKLGLAAVIYATLSICHAIYLLGAVGEHERASLAAPRAA